MGDRCHVDITVRLVDRAHFEELGYEESYDPPEVVDDGSLDMEGEEMNHGGTDDLISLATAQQVPFYGQHDYGGEYDSEIFASANGQYVWMREVDGFPAVKIDHDDAVDQDDLTAARLYWRLYREAYVQIHGREAPEFQQKADE